ncbi:MAG: single-stranded DNA-binding protein [Janthinobacterium lividum]
MGYVGADPKPLTSENAPIRLAIATPAHWMVEGTRNSRTDWHAVSVFGNLRRYAAKLKRGDRVYVEGEANRTIGGETITFYDTEYVASEIECVNAKSSGDAQD